MEVELLRYNSKSDFTDGLLFIDGVFSAHTMEDEFRTAKVYGETRIPDGTYNIILRKEGGFHKRYLKRYGGGFHQGMLWLQDVVGFKWILIHIGNTDDDTAGCILVGTTAHKDKAFTGGSADAYKEIYPKIARAILAEEEVKITIETIA